MTRQHRKKISEGLDVLESLDLIIPALGRSTYVLANHNQIPWGKVPGRALYDGKGRIRPFQPFTLRTSNELHALKIYFFLVFTRNNDLNVALASHKKMRDATGVPPGSVSHALTALSFIGLVQRDHLMRPDGTLSPAYRLTHVDPYLHLGTRSHADVVNQA